jgi:predicted nucleotidyltransferase
VTKAPKQLPEQELIGPALALVPGVDFAIVFGSVARGAPRADSDLDVAISGASLDPSAIAAILSERLGREAHVVRLDEATIPLLEAIIDDGIVVYERRAGAVAAWRSHALADLELDRPWYARQRDAWLKRVAERGL